MTPLEKKLRADLIAVGNEVGYLWQYHDLFWIMMDVANNNNRVLETGGDLLDWIKNSYIEAGSVAFRRQLDRDKRSISLVNLLVEIQKNHAQFTREQFQRKIAFPPGHNFHRKDKWDAAGDEFDNVFGKRGHLDPAIVQADIDLIEREGKAIKEQVNKEIAHKDRRGMQGAKATGQIFEACVNHLDEIVGKYAYLLDGKRLESLRPQFQYDVEEVFTFPWKT